ncbi:hypothetical protein ABZ470_23695 [Streptosporangium sp. NPDC020072]|uniref:hypothetical protein n=1 Tax=Streptosporangium sp. NPDC020072 TaxID=3154788 RepID=UPI0034280569
MPPKKGSPEKDWAEYYGWAVALLKSDPSLAKLFQDAIKQNYTRERFVAELRKTKWYQKNGESARQTLALKYSDPETWRQRVRTIYQNILSLAGTMGVKANWQTMWDMAEDALMFGWDNAKLRSTLAGYLKAGKGYGGEAKQSEDQLRQYAYSMGIRIDESAIGGWLKGILGGTRTIEDYKGYIQKMALSAFPSLADQIKGGLSVRDIASPYTEAMARILEINGGDLDLFDSQIRKAMTNVNQQTGKSELKPLWQFEEELKKDPRWLKTNNARESLNGVAHNILKDWGFAY